MRILTARFRSGSDFLDRYQDAFAYGGLFLPTRQVIDPGELVVLDVRMPSLRDHMLLRGMVAWHRRGKRAENLRAGLGVELLASEQESRDYLLALARGEVDGSAQRRHRRLPTALSVGWRIPEDTRRHQSYVDDISIGGAFLRTDEPPTAGTPLLLEIIPPGGTAPQVIECRVAWTRRGPGVEGVGIEFRCRGVVGMRRLRELVRRVEQDSPLPS
jgi:Tfp pilus assembly protein PilZ